MRCLVALSAAALSMVPVMCFAQDGMKPMAPAVSAPKSSIQIETLPPPSSPAMSVADKVAADWAKYDMGAKGHLNRAELGRWLGDLRAANGESAPDDKWIGSAFAQTDSNKDKKITREELATSLSSGR